MFIFLILGLLLGGFVVVFALQNITTISVVFLGWQVEGSLALILALAVASGIVICLLFSLPEVIRTRFQISKLKRDKENLVHVVTTKEEKIQEEQNKVAATNAYLDGVQNRPKDII
ncbi:MAG: LapA family protein [bacterium]|nr:LapA family protein [bacterium]